MKWLDLVKLCFGNLWRRKLRSVLTLLGVIIGTASIVTMLSIGLAQSKAMQEMIMGSTDLTTISVMNPNEGGEGPMGNQAGPTPKKTDQLKLTQETIKSFENLPHVSYVSPVLELGIQLIQGNAENYINLQGLTAEALAAKKIHIEEGVMPDFNKEYDHLPIIIGRDIASHFYNPNSQNYEEVKVDLIKQTVFGIIENTSQPPASSGDNSPAPPPPKKHIMKFDGIMGTESAEGWSEDLYSAYTELGHLERFLAANFQGKAWPRQAASKSGKPVGELVYNSAIIGSSDLKYTKEIMNQIRSMGFVVNSNIEFIETMQKQSATQQMVLGGIGGISLFVAAIGIANTMMMSVYERTKEIGIFKVLGCSLANIRNIFLGEAALIGLIGGILGIGLSFIVSAILNGISGESIGMYVGEGMALSYIPPWLVMGAIIFAMLIGIIAGVLPARRAMKLSALEAIRNQ